VFQLVFLCWPLPQISGLLATLLLAWRCLDVVLSRLSSASYSFTVRFEGKMKTRRRMCVKIYTVARSHDHCWHRNAIRWLRCSSQQCKRVYCCYGNLTVGSICTLVGLKIFLTAFSSNNYSVTCLCVFLPVWNSHLFCAVMYCHLWPVWLYHIFPHCLINCKIFGKMILNIKCVLVFSTILVRNVSYSK